MRPLQATNVDDGPGTPLGELRFRRPQHRRKRTRPPPPPHLQPTEIVGLPPADKLQLLADVLALEFSQSLASAQCCAALRRLLPCLEYLRCACSAKLACSVKFGDRQPRRPGRPG